MTLALDLRVGWQFDLVVLPLVVLGIVLCAVIFANQQRRR